MTVCPVSVVVPTLNEAANLPACLESVHNWVDEIVVVDSFSSDDTIAIAESFGAKVHQHEYAGAPQQWKWILENVELTNNWVLALDADYVVTPELRNSIIAEMSDPWTMADGYYLRHRQMFRGRFIRHGGIYPRYRLTFFRREKVLVDDLDLVDNRFYVSGRVERLEHDLVEENAKEGQFSVWLQKQVHYAQRAADEELNRRSEDSPIKGVARGGRNERVLWLKGYWARLPLYWRSVGYFIYRYFFRLGFLDGREGFLYHFSQALLYRIALDARVEELTTRITTETAKRRFMGHRPGG